MESFKTKMDIAVNIDKEVKTITVTFIDKVNDIRRVEYEKVNGNQDTVVAEYPVVTKYLVEDESGKLFTIYSHQIKKIHRNTVKK